jgi:ABC-2 type transport system permease protein
MQRELLSLFCSPIAYVVIAGFLLIIGVWTMYQQTIAPGRQATLRDLFTITPFVLTIVIPAIAMRSIAEEYRSGTIESLMTAPVADAELVLGKFLASLLFYVILLATTLIYMVVLAIYGRPDWGASASAYLGLLMIGVFFLAYSVFASSLTSNQIVAWMLGAVPLMLFAWFGYYFSSALEGWAREAFRQINVIGRFEQFSRGLITIDSVVFFVAASGVFLFLTVKVVESRRWR